MTRASGGVFAFGEAPFGDTVTLLSRDPKQLPCTDHFLSEIVGPIHEEAFNTSNLVGLRSSATAASVSSPSTAGSEE